jgi:hypothetical protein
MNIFVSQLKKVALISAVLAVFGGAIQPAAADVPAVPILVSFTVSPNSIDIATTSTLVTLDLVVNSPTGIFSSQTLVTLTDGGNNKVIVPIIRTDLPLNSSLQTVEFKGTYSVTSNLPTGVYKANAAPIYSLTSTGGQGYPSQILNATTTSTVVGAENGLLVRNGGYLNYSYSTFSGPTFQSLVPHIFTNPKYNSATPPIWKVGETFNPADYYELTVPTLTLRVKATTPSVCTSNGMTIKLVAVGDCGFIVYTDKTLDYQYREDNEIVAITAARTKPSFSLGTIPTQSSASLPLSIQGPFVYSPFGLIIPTSATPTVCYAVGSFISIISGGTCTLNYSTPESASYLASDIAPLTFQITRTAQTLNFTPPASVLLTAKTLSLTATSSSGAAVTFQSDTPVICSVTGNSLKLLKSGSCQVTALQVGTPTIESVSVPQSIMVIPSARAVGSKPAIKKIVCIRNGKSKTVTGTKCPAGYKAKR